jgi:hypothetical protein
MLGGRNLEDIDSDDARVDIDSERVKEGVTGRGCDVVYIGFKCHIAELAVGEVDWRGSPGADVS